LECVIGSSGIMRQAVAQALHHTAHRSAFKKRLIEQPLMQNVLADLAVESEAATTMMLRLARAYDEAPTDETQAHFARLATAVSKYWVCKRAPGMVYEALECHGGNGYVEDSILPRLLREAPVNSVWEGSGNVICLDVLRAMAREPESLEAFLAELALSKGMDRRLDEFTAGLMAELHDRDDMEVRARRVVSRMALALQGSLLVRHAPPAVSDAFCGSRLEGSGDRVFGMLPPGLELDKIVNRARPTV
jgi:putative acyl-CoA dehydrogenase